MKKRWTKEEIEHLKNGDTHLLARSEGAIEAKRKKLGLNRENIPWSREELDILFQNWYNDNLLELLPRRTKSAIESQKSRLRKTRNHR